MGIIRSDKGSRQYIVTNIDKCEYADMLGEYSLTRQVLTEECSGFSNRYDKNVVSKICVKCEHFRRQP